MSITDNSQKFYDAHSANACGSWHPLREHLTCVSKLARDFLQGHHSADEAGLAGLLHDLGKYADLFQARLRGEAQGLDHWSQGAWIALSEYKAIAAALAIQGHHIGLQRADNSALRGMDPRLLEKSHPLRLTLSDSDLPRLKQRASDDQLILKTPTPAISSWEHAVAKMLDVRMLFSALVDADYLDTEAHFNGDEKGKRYRSSGPPLNAQAALEATLDHIRRISADNNAANLVAAVRELLLRDCLSAAEKPIGHYTLTAPTGSGKTLAMLAFALAHAAKHGLKRIVLAVPYLTIIEQTSGIYRSIFTANGGFDEHHVLEHHSMAGMGKETNERDNEGTGVNNESGDAERQRRLLSQNWDAPIVITTNVQLLESLFSNRPVACRKLHNLMESVILFDEAQSLPQSLAVPTLAALSHLSAAYRSTVMFATATQPAFDELDAAVKKQAISGWNPGHIVENHAPMFHALKRVEVVWPKDGQNTSWEDLAEKIHSTSRVLCIVNLKRHARMLVDALKGDPDLFHLSTNLCPEHRRNTLDVVRKRLETRDRSCKLVSTQCVEAGVDVDFPNVFRAFGPLESVAQAAGRCNREGRLPDMGTVVVFDPVEEGNWRCRYPSFAYYQAAEVTRTILAGNGAIDINDPASFQDYYRRLYDLGNPATQNAGLDEAIKSLDFPDIAHRYRLIDQDAIQVLVPWSKQRMLYDTLRKEEAARGIGNEWMRQAQGIAVGIYRPRQDHPAWSVLVPAKLRFSGKRASMSDEWFILEDPGGRYYDDLFGLQLPDSDPIFIA